MRYCSVIGCSSNNVRIDLDGERIAFFQVPQDPDVRSKWWSALGDKIAGDDFKKYHVICEKHFSQEDALSTADVKSSDGAHTRKKRSKLKRGSVPLPFTKSINVISNVGKARECDTTNKSRNGTIVTNNEESPVLSDQVTSEKSVDTSSLPSEVTVEEKQKKLPEPNDESNLPKNQIFLVEENESSSPNGERNPLELDKSENEITVIDKPKSTLPIVSSGFIPRMKAVSNAAKISPFDATNVRLPSEYWCFVTIRDTVIFQKWSHNLHLGLLSSVHVLPDGQCEIYVGTKRLPKFEEKSVAEVLQEVDNLIPCKGIEYETSSYCVGFIKKCKSFGRPILHCDPCRRVKQKQAKNKRRLYETIGKLAGSKIKVPKMDKILERKV